MMSEPRRWEHYEAGNRMVLNREGDWMKYADHVEALRQAEQRVEVLAEYPMNHPAECAWFRTADPCDCVLAGIIAAIKGGAE